MDKLFVNEESSYELMKLGFKEECLAYYIDGELWYGSTKNITNYIIAPVYTQAIQFLDNFDDIYIEINNAGYSGKYNVCVNEYLCDDCGDWLKLDFYEAYQLAVEESIKILKKLV